MDQDVIRSLKTYYKTMSIKRLIEAIEKKKPLPEFSILDAMQILDAAWAKLRPKLLLALLKKLEFQNKSTLRSPGTIG